MNLSTIRDTVAQLVPAAREIRFREMGSHVYALLCEIEGRMRSVMFTSYGLYGDGVATLAVLGQWPKSDLHLAVQLAKALES